MQLERHRGRRAAVRRYRRWSRGSTCAAGIVHQILQLLARLEIGDALGRHLYARTGLGIATHSRLPLARAEAAESTNLDLIPRSQRAHDAVEDSFYNYLGILTGHLHHPRDLLDQFGLRHVCFFSLFW